MIFWIDSGSSPKIMSASLSGENPKVLVNTQLGMPTSLAIDFFKDNRLYWCDEKNNFIESINYDGSDRVRIHHNGFNKPYRIDIFENYIYLLSQENGAINKVDKYGRGGLFNVVKDLDLSEDIKIFHPSKVPKNIKNPCENSTCSHLCLLKPNNDYKCACPDGTNFLNDDLYTCDSG